MKWLCSSGMQHQQPDTVTHTRISSLLISRRLTRARIADRQRDRKLACQSQNFLRAWTVVYNHWTGLVDWWTELKIIFMLSNENSPVGLHLETLQLLASLPDSPLALMKKYFGESLGTRLATSLYRIQQEYLINRWYEAFTLDSIYKAYTASLAWDIYHW